MPGAPSMKLDALSDLLREARGASRRDALALVAAEDASQTITYGQLDDLCAALGGHLRGACGLAPGDVVSIVLPRRVSLAQVVGTLGAMAARLVAAPLNPTYHVEELEFFIGDAEAKVVVVEAANASAKSAWLAATALGLPTLPMELSWTASGPALTLGAGGGAPAVDLEPALPTDLALVLHTSGTTSRPKLVPLTHKNMCASVVAVVNHYGITARDATLIVQPLFHIGGLVTPLLSTLSVGGRVAIASMFDDGKHWQFVATHGVSWFTAVPTIHKVLLANAARDFRPSAFASGAVPELRFIRSGSAALPPDFLAKIEASFRAPLIESYGMTEAAQLICANPLPPGDRYAGSVGICAGPEGRVFNAETGRRAEEDDEGCAGEMCIAGPSVMSGYARNPAANDGAFFADPDDDPTNFKWFRTGDLVSRTKAGYYSIVGRIKEIINRAGEKIAPAKLDKVLAYDGRKDSVVTFGVHCPDFGQAVACAMVFDPDKFADDVLAGPEAARRAKLLLETALKKLAPHELPTVVYAILKDDVPKTATGKTKRIKCGEVTEATQKPVVDKGVWRSFDDDDGSAKPAAAATPSDAPPPPPPGDAKEAKARALAAIADALISVGVPLAVPDDAPFMQSGLTSMMVFAFVKALGATLDVGNLPHMLVFDAPTPNALASELAGRLGAGGNGHAKLDLTAAAGGEGVAVCVRAASWRLPGEALKPYLADPDAIRLMLDTHAHARSAVPADRWSAATLAECMGGIRGEADEGIRMRASYGGFVADLDMFDRHRFGVSLPEATLMDPQQRLLMEHGYAALEVARLVPSRRRESDAEPGDRAADVGVFVGLSFHDWALANFWDGKPQSRRSVFASSGSFTSVASGRLSFVLGLQGPCSTINTACSSGLVALQGAHDATAGGDAASGALACGVNVVLEPTISINFAVKGITSPRGRCWTFDASADGYLRSEAAGCFAVAPVDDALDASGFSEDAYCATSLGVSVRHDGKSASLTAPNGSAQHAMIVFALRAKARGAYAFAGVEAHGTATPLGDPIEIGALAKLSGRLDASGSLAVSGAKNAFGHGEAAAGSVGLLALLIGGVRRGDVACNGALRSANPAVRDGVVDGMGSFLLLGATDAVALNLGKQDACCGVSSLGASGTIAHALLKCVDVGSERELPLVADGLASEWPPIRQRESFKWQPYEPPSGAAAAAAATVDAGGGLQLVRDAVARFVGEVGDDDDLFDVGGLDSLVAIELLAELQAAVDVDLPQTLIVECPTVNAAGAVVDAALASSAGSRRVAVSAGADDVENTEGDDGPSIIVKKRVAALEAPLREGEQIFFVHGVDGDPLGMLFHSVAASLRFPSSTVRCIEKPKVVAATLEDLAQYYVDRIRERQPEGPYRIFGHSFGALIAHQVALMFEANGQTVAALVLGDFEVTYPPSRSKRAAKNPGDAGRFGVEEWEGGEIESIKLACRRFGSLADGGAFDPDEFRNKVLTNASGPKDRRMRAMYHYMPGYMQRKEWDRLLDLWERNMEYLHTVTVPKFGPKKRETFEPQGMVQGPTLHLRALGSKEFAAAEEINRTYCADYTVAELDGLHYNFLQAPYCDAVAEAIDAFVVRRAGGAPPPPASPPSSPRSPGGAVATLAALAASQAAKLGDAPFLEAWDRKAGVVESVSFRDFGRRVRATAERLPLARGDSCAVLVHPTVAAHVALLALAAAGVVGHVLNATLSLDSWTTMVGGACRGLLCGLSLREGAGALAQTVASKEVLVLLGAGDAPKLGPKERPLDTTAPRGARDLEPDAAVGADDVAFVLFTSGTTGAPKAVAQTHGKILAAADRMFRYEAGGSAAATQGATLAFLPLYHNLGLYHNFVLNLRAGSKTLVHAAAPSMPLTLGLLLEAAPALKPTSLEVVAVLAEQLAQLLAVGGELGNDIKQRLASLDSVKVGGSPLSAEAHVSLTNAGLAVLQHYGQTELCGYVLASAPRKRGAPPPVGRANALHKVDAAVAYDLRGGGAVGELVLAGLQDEPYATGDIFRRGDDGSLTFHARVDGMLVLGSGEMVDPAPLERALLAKLAGDVVRCCLVGDGRPRPALLLELRGSARDGDGLPTEDALLGVEAALADVQADAPAATRILDTHVLVLDEPLPVTLKGAVDVTAAMDRKKTVLKQADDGVLLDDSLAALKRVCYANE